MILSFADFYTPTHLSMGLVLRMISKWFCCCFL